MVTHLLRLRRLLANGFRRSTWTLISAVIGAIGGLFILAGLVAGMIALSFVETRWAWAVAVLGGALAVLGRVVVPLLVRGMD
ncbi:MAG: transporter [Naasia sp.]|nr:transporter [Naasia sp.]